MEPSWSPSPFFLGQGSPTKSTTEKRNGTLILTSLLEDLAYVQVERRWPDGRLYVGDWCEARSRLRVGVLHSKAPCNSPVGAFKHRLLAQRGFHFGLFKEKR